MVNDEYAIALLIAEHIANTISDEDRRDLDAWRNENPAHESLFQRLISPENFNRLNEEAKNYNADAAYESVLDKIAPKTQRTFNSWFYYAAAAVLCIGLIVFFRYSNFQTDDGTSALTTQSAAPAAGSSKATLILDNGDKIELDGKESFIIQEQNGATIAKDSSGLNYALNQKGNGVIYNQIVVPRGGEYSLVLSDGTQIFLNALSSLRYPVAFPDDIRQVELSGEAYFAVRESATPFVVATHDSQITVSGTSFNVSSYPDDKIVRTTLISGKVTVKLTDSGKEITLKPLEQIALGTRNGQYEINTVDARAATAWKDGVFYFKDWKLEDIMHALSRWYDFEVEYRDAGIEQYRFGGKFNRYENMQPILDILEATGKIKTEIKDKKIIFTKNQY